jgi:hypothetical protein
VAVMSSPREGFVEAFYSLVRPTRNRFCCKLLQIGATKQQVPGNQIGEVQCRDPRITPPTRWVRGVLRDVGLDARQV